MEEVIANVITIDGKEFFLIKNLDQYSFYSEIANPDNICVLKEIEEDGESFYVSLEDDELDKVMYMYHEKFGDAS